MTTPKAARKELPARPAPRNPKARAEECLDNALRRGRIASQTVENGWRHFHYAASRDMRSSSARMASCCSQVLVEVMALPSDGALVIPLMHELLEGNAYIPGPARFAICATG